MSELDQRIDPASFYASPEEARHAGAKEFCIRVTRRVIGFGCLTLLAIASVALAWPVIASAGTITVTDNNDSGPGSLRQAIASAATGDTIIVPANTYTLTSGQLAIAKSLTITGAGADKTFVDGGGISRVFETSGTTSKITIRGLTIRDGRAPVESGTAQGGGVLNVDATLTLTNDWILGDSAVASGAGPGGSGGVAYGGGVSNEENGTLNLRNSQLSTDIAAANGNSGQVGDDAFGGGVVSGGALTVVGSTFSSDSAAARGGSGAGGGNAWGGGLAIFPMATSSVSSSTFSGNSVDASGTGGGSGGNAWGGGAILDTNSPDVTLTNATVTGNTAQTTAGGEAEGGGLNWGSNGPVVTLANDTISANTATGATTVPNVGNAVLDTPKIEVRNTIISHGVGDPGSQNCATVADKSLGHNLDSLDQCGFHAAGDLVNTNPLLGPLRDNGGPTETMALRAGSPAIDAGAGCAGPDQRGTPRPGALTAGETAGSACDIGAYERARCEGVLVNVVGTAGADVLTGTPGRDGILGLGGADRINPGGGSDGICAGPGNDRVALKDGAKDHANGGPGTDTVSSHDAGLDVLNNFEIVH